jgi:hypothetical protein
MTNINEFVLPFHFFEKGNLYIINHTSSNKLIFLWKTLLKNWLKFKIDKPAISKAFNYHTKKEKFRFPCSVVHTWTIKKITFFIKKNLSASFFLFIEYFFCFFFNFFFQYFVNLKLIVIIYFGFFRQNYRGLKQTFRHFVGAQFCKCLFLLSYH